MVELQNYNREQKSFLYCFQHRRALYVPNFSKIISLEIKDFTARLSKNSGQGKSFLWGSYDLHFFYCRFVQGDEVTERKVFPRNFSAHLAVLPVFAGENFDTEKINFVVTDSYDTAVEPLLPALFPLMGRLNYLPFKISVGVTGHVYAVLEGAQNLEAERIKTAVAAGRGGVPGVTVEKAKATLQGPAAITEKLGATEKTPAAVAEGSVEVGEGPAPAAGERTKTAKFPQAAAGFTPDSHYYKQYRLFYEHFFPEKHADNISQKK